MARRDPPVVSTLLRPGTAALRNQHRLAPHASRITHQSNKLMTTTPRKGKIAHLPRNLRDELSQRIDNGTPGPQLLAWLNADPEVQAILAQYFGGRPITKQNLSEWRNGGYQD